MSDNERTVQPGCGLYMLLLGILTATITVAVALLQIRDVLKAGCQ